MGLQANPLESDVDTLRQQLRLDNISKVEHSDEEIELAILLRAEKEELVAGISSTLWGHCLEIDYLWLSETHCDQGISKRLTIALEKAAADLGCSIVITNTFSFQASDFYTNLGYDVSGVISGYGKRCQKYFLRKSL